MKLSEPGKQAGRISGSRRSMQSYILTRSWFERVKNFDSCGVAALDESKEVL